MWLVLLLHLSGCAARSPYLPPVTPVESLTAAYSLLPGPAQQAEVQLLVDNHAAWRARWHLIASAKRQIDAAYFIVEDDDFGLAFLGHLYKRAQEGIKVRLLMDARGSFHFGTFFLGHPLMNALAATGNADVRIYNPPLGRITDAVISASLVPTIASNHDKILIVDGEQAIVGGRNIANHYFDHHQHSKPPTFDVDLMFQSKDAAQTLQRLFLEEFEARRVEKIEGGLFQTREPASLLLRHFYREEASIHSLRQEAESSRWAVEAPSPKTIGAEVRILRSGSRATESEREVATGLLQALTGAQRTIHIETPYLILTKDMLQVLRAAAARGVEITVLTNGPSSSDNAASQAFFIDEWPELLDRIPTMRLFVVDSSALMHAKRVVVDDQLTLIGTFNLDPLSARVNSEIIIAAWSAEFAEFNRRSVVRRISSDDIIEYRIFRDLSGNTIRFPVGHRQEGEIIIATGPASHTPPASLARLRLLRTLLSSFIGIIDFTPVRF